MLIYLGKRPGYEGNQSVFPFVKNLITYLDRMRVRHTFDEGEGADIALCIQWEPPLKVVRQLKRSGAKIVHRLDGRARSLVKVYDKDKENRRINELADWTVFQSQYVQEHTTMPVKTIFGTEAEICRSTDRSSIIYNGVDRSVFNNSGDRIELKGKHNILHVAFTHGIRKGTKAVLRYAELLKNNPDVHFYLIGRQPDDYVVGHRLGQYGNITTLGVIYDQQLMAAYMRSVSLLLFPSEFDYCPNTVLEAMACGLPVLYHDSGGTPELVRGGNEKAGLPMTEDNPIYSLHALLENRDEFGRGGMANVSERFSLEQMGEAYLTLFNSLL